MSLKENLSSKIIFLLLFLCFALLLTIGDRAPIHLKTRFHDVRLEDEFQLYLNGVVNRTLPGPYIYRILVPYSIYYLSNLVPIISSMNFDFILKSLLIFLTQWLLFEYFLSFMSAIVSFCGVVLYDFLLSFALTYIQGPSLIETADILNTLIFIVALLALLNNKSLLLYASLFIGIMNRETVWLILPIIFIHDRIITHKSRRFVIATLIVALSYFAIHFFLQTNNGGWATFEGLTRNIPFISSEHLLNALISSLHVVIFLGPFIALSIYRFNDQPLFLKIAASITPLFIVVHYLFGTIIEARLWLPLFVILMPLVLNNLFRNSASDRRVT